MMKIDRVKTLLYRLCDRWFDLSNKQIAQQVLCYAVNELTSYPGNIRITKESLRRNLIIRAQQQLTATQFDYLLKILPYHLSQYGYKVLISTNDLWVVKPKSQNHFAV